MRNLARRLVDLLLVHPARKFIIPRKILAYASERTFGIPPQPYNDYRTRFIAEGDISQYGIDVRREIIERFERIDSGVENIATNPTDGLFLAQALLGLDCPGDIVECGCFTGGSTSKLSILAKITGRQLVVFDSFEGLPETDATVREDTNVRMQRALTIDWKSGLYDASVEHVRNNIEKFGEVSVCRFVKGWFCDTLTSKNLPDQIAFAFTDVDLASSAQDCVLGLWPQLVDKGVFFSHDAPFLKVLQVFTNPKVWSQVNDRPPVVFGAGYGFGDSSPGLAMMIKGDLNNEYLNQLTLRIYVRTLSHRQHAQR